MASKPGPTPPNHALNMTAQRNSDAGASCKCSAGHRVMSQGHRQPKEPQSRSPKSQAAWATEEDLMCAWFYSAKQSVYSLQSAS